jgi:hypothetical protein
MLTLDEARLSVLSELRRSNGVLTGPEEIVIVDEHTIVRPWGWVFFYTSRGWLDGDDRYALGGNAPIIVDRTDGSLHVTGAAEPIEHYIQNYEKGFKYDLYDLTILSVVDLPTTLDCLVRLYMQYVVPEFEHGTWWKIPRTFTRKQLADRLSRLPCDFENQGLSDRVEELEQMKCSGCCKFELRGRLAPDGPPGELIY